VKDWQTTERQMDHATVKCAGIGGIACAARAYSKNDDKRHGE